MKRNFDQYLSFGIFVSVEAGCVENCSSVLWVKKGGKNRMWAGYKVHMNDIINTKAYSLSCKETIFSKIFGYNFFCKKGPLKCLLAKCSGRKISRSLYREYNPKTCLSYSFTVRIEKCTGYVSTTNRGNFERTDRMRCFPRWYRSVRFSRCRTPKKTKSVMERLKSKQFTVNLKKCVSFKTSLSPLQHIFPFQTESFVSL